MADLSFLNNYRYFRAGYPVTRVFIENIILPGLDSPDTRGIKLPQSLDETTPEYLSKIEAAHLVLDWLIENENLKGDENSGPAKSLYDLVKQASTHSSSFSKFAIIVTTTYLSRVAKPGQVFTVSIADRLAEYRKVASSPPQTGAYNPASIIDEYNSVYQEILRLSQMGIPANIAASLIPAGASQASANLTRKALAKLIATNLARLEAARLLQPGSKPEDLELQAFYVTKEFEKILDDHPDLDGYRNFLGDKDHQSKLRDYVAVTAQEFSGGNLEKILTYETQQIRAAGVASDLLPTDLELIQKITSVLIKNNISSGESQEIANALVKQMVSSSVRPESATVILENALRAIKISPQNSSVILQALSGEGLDIALEYRARELRLEISSLPPSGRALLLQGINPLHVLKDFSTLKREAGELLGKNVSELPDDGAEILREVSAAFEHKRATLSASEFGRYHSWVDSVHTHLSLTPRQNRIARRSRTEQALISFTNRVNAARDNLLDKWIDISDTLTGRKLFNKLADWVDTKAETWLVALPFTKGKVKIPILRPLDWAVNTWHNFKLGKASNWLSALSGNNSPLGRFTRFSLSHYIKGEASLNGMFFSAARDIWSKRVITPLVNWVSTKITKGTFKYVTKSLARTGTRFLLKLGGKALAKFGAKIVTALAAAGTFIGSILSVAMLVSLVFDLVKLAFDLVKEFLTNVNFRKQILKAFAIVGSVIAALHSLPLIAIIGIIIGSVIQLIILASSVAFGLTAGLTLFYNVFKTSVLVAPEYEGPASIGCFQPIECTNEKAPPGIQPTTKSPIAERAYRIVSDLYQGFWCYWNRPANPAKTQQYISFFKTVDTVLYADSNHPDIFNYETYLTTPNPTREQIQSCGECMYWCTYLVQHAFRESGNNSLANTLWSPSMQDDFEKRGKFIGAASARADNVMPGAVIFFKTSGGPDRTNHVGVVNSVNEDGLTFYQSNAATKSGNATFGSNGLQDLPGIAIVGIGNP